MKQIRIAIPTNRPQAVVNYLNALTELGSRGEAGRSFDPSEYDGLLLPGGWDVNPARYGKDRVPQETVDDDLDTLQFEVLERFLAAGRPVFGICRGHQLLNIAFGGTLIQHLPCAENHMGLPTGEDNLHRAQVEPDSFLYRIYGAECTVNSTHHQAVKRPAPGIKITAVADDGIPEAFESLDGQVVAVQFHPEKLIEGGDISWISLFRESLLNHRKGND